MNNPSTENRDRIDLNDKAACESWVKKLNITHEKLHEAVGRRIGAKGAERCDRHWQELARGGQIHPTLARSRTRTMRATALGTSDHAAT